MTQLKKSLNPKSFQAGTAALTKMIQETAAKDLKFSVGEPDASQAKKSSSSSSSQPAKRSKRSQKQATKSHSKNRAEREALLQKADIMRRMNKKSNGED